ncbi:MAG: O-succinylhomoserine (thiol)-lyase [Zetaproteobacteria bacterium]|nr:MAG: O-succinylhomoserine (thiol)-lyase [Zetaproteobacteria bacterium]
MPQDKKRRTSIVQAGIGTDKAYKAIISPLYLSSTFEIDGIDQHSKYEYSRTCNPTRDELVKAITTLEHGIGGCVTSSGMAALTLIIHLLNPDDLLIAPFDCYGRSYRMLSALSEKGHFKLEFIDQYDPQAVEEAFKAKPKMMLIESPSNPVMRTADIVHITTCAKQCNTIVIVDNTFLSPMLQQPLKLGADIVFHSTTKFLNGHSDVVGGCVITSDKDILTDLEFWANSLGLIGAPFDAYMTLRGMRTLELRVHRAQENAQIIAEMLDNHAIIDTVYYPGLPKHPGHDIAKKQQDGFGAMLSFEIKGEKQNAVDFVDHLEIFRLAQSLGGTESLINHPASMTHVSMGKEARAKAGVTDQLLRLSVGVEHIDDLLDDLTQALDHLG